MKTILCFGDSLTWGFNPKTNTRHPYEARWTGMLQQRLGSQYRVIEEGLNGRTSVSRDPFIPNRNGSKVLPIMLEAHSPIDLVILQLGTNDLKPYILGSAKKSALGFIRLIHIILSSQSGPAFSPPKILLLSPPHIGKLNPLMGTMLAGMEIESKELAQHYRCIAEFFRINFLDTSLFLVSSAIDGVHLDQENNEKLALELESKIKEIFPPFRQKETKEM